MRIPTDDLVWRRSTRCSSGACVEVADNVDTVLVRDSKDPGGTVLAFARLNWNAFLAAVKSGTFDQAR
jgi:hypothetical protein